MPTTRFEFGDVVLVPFPFTGLTDTKRRPAVVVSSKAYNAVRPDLVIAAITSQLRSGSDPGAFLVADWSGAGLLKPSAVKPVFATLEQRLVLRRLGRFGDLDREILRAVIIDALGPATA